MGKCSQYCLEYAPDVVSCVRVVVGVHGRQSVQGIERYRHGSQIRVCGGGRCAGGASALGPRQQGALIGCGQPLHTCTRPCISLAALVASQLLGYHPVEGRCWVASQGRPKVRSSCQEHPAQVQRPHDPPGWPSDVPRFLISHTDDPCLRGAHRAAHLS